MLHFSVASSKIHFSLYSSFEQTLQQYPQTTTMKPRHVYYFSSLRDEKTHRVKGPLLG